MSFKLKFYASDRSETVNKKEIYMCLKDSNGQYYDYNMLMYVAIHELSHAISVSIDEDHENTSSEFMNNMNMLLEKAKKLRHEASLKESLANRL